MNDAVRKILESVGERVNETATLAFLVEVLESYRTLRDADAQRLFAGLKGHLQYKLALAPDSGGIELTPGQNIADDLLKVLADPAHKITGITVIAMLAYLFHLQGDPEFKTERIKDALDGLPECRQKGNPSSYLATLNARGVLAAEGSKGEHKTFRITANGIEEAQELLSDYLQA